MKKILFIIIILIIAIVYTVYSVLSTKSNNIPQSVIIEEEYEIDPQLVFKSIDLNNAKDICAQKILYEYIMEDFQVIFENDEKISEKFKELELDIVRATFVDLNDDNENEIIGFVTDGMFGGTSGQELFILGKDKNDKYQLISEYLNFANQKNIFILKDKDNGYHRIIIYSSGLDFPKPFLVEYNDGVYSSAEQFADFLNVMKDANKYDISNFISK